MSETLQPIPFDPEQFPVLLDKKLEDLRNVIFEAIAGQIGILPYICDLHEFAESFCNDYQQILLKASNIILAESGSVDFNVEEYVANEFRDRYYIHMFNSLVEQENDNWFTDIGWIWQQKNEGIMKSGKDEHRLREEETTYNQEKRILEKHTLSKYFSEKVPTAQIEDRAFFDLLHTIHGELSALISEALECFAERKAEFLQQFAHLVVCSIYGDSKDLKQSTLNIFFEFQKHFASSYTS